MARNYVIIRALKQNGSYDVLDSRTALPNIIIESLGERVKPQQEAERINISGRNGSIYIRQGYADSTRTIRVGLLSNGSIDDVIKFFNNEGQITFSDEPNYYYEFLQLGQIIFNKIGIYKEAEIELILKPFHYKEDGAIVCYEDEIQIFNEGTVYSTPMVQFLPSVHPAQAEYWILNCTKQAGTTLNSASIVFRVDSIPQNTSYAYIDTETGNVFYTTSNGNVFIPRQIDSLLNFWLPPRGLGVEGLYYSMGYLYQDNRYSYTGIWVIDKASRYL